MEMNLFHILALLPTGMVAGFASGLIGVGGAFVMVPVQFWMLTSIGVDPTIAIRISLGTSLLVVLPTAVSGAVAHHRNGAVRWKAGVILGVAGASASFGGAYVASLLPARVLTTIFGCMAIFLAIRMAVADSPHAGESRAGGLGRLFVSGGLFGFISGIIGVGGGGMIIPVMTNFLGFGLHEAVGTSAAFMIFTALGGSISYLVNGLGVEGLPAYSTGYLNWQQFVLLAGSSIPMAVVGAKAAHAISPKRLSIVLALVLVGIGMKMTGVLSWLARLTG